MVHKMMYVKINDISYLIKKKNFSHFMSEEYEASKD